MFFLLKPSISLTRCFAVLSFLSSCHAGLVLFSGGREYFWSLETPLCKYLKQTKSLLRFFKSLLISKQIYSLSVGREAAIIGGISFQMARTFFVWVVR